MKIALVTAFPPSTGSLNEYGYHLALEFAERSDVSEVVIIADKMRVETEETVLNPKIRILRTWNFNSLLTPLKIAGALRRQQPDGVLYNLQMVTFGDREIPAALGLFTPLLTRLWGLRSGVLIHNLIEGVDLENTILKGNWVRQKIVGIGGWLASWAMTRANYLTTTLDTYSDLLCQRFPKADISMVPHGTFQRPEIDLAPVNKRQKRIVTMGKFGTYKRLGTLLQAFSLLKETDEELELVIGGSDHPNAAGYMEEMKEKFSWVKDVTFAGYVPEEDVPEFFADAMLAVFDYEATTGSSGVLHQCASYGTVPVFPRIGDFVELCTREGLDGVHYSPGNENSMLLAISEILNNPVRLSQMSEKNLDAIEEMPLSKVIDFHIRKFSGTGTEKIAGKRSPIIPTAIAE